MKNQFISEVVTSSALLIILLYFLKPNKLLMPNSVELMLTLFLLLAFLVFLALVWKEKTRDERENYHRMNASRVSFVAGSSILIIGIIVQSAMRSVDPWLIYTLIAMIFAKIATRIYLQIKS